MSQFKKVPKILSNIILILSIGIRIALLFCIIYAAIQILPLSWIPSPPVFSAIIAGIGLIWGIYWAVRQYTQQKRKEESRFYLDRYLAFLKIILEHLQSDKPTRRMAWVTAAAIAEKCKEIEAKITSPVDQDCLKIYLRDYMHHILVFLSGKTACYFYGVEDMPDLSDAARIAGLREIKIADSLTANFSPSYIDESQIVSILRLINNAIKEDSKVPIISDRNTIYQNVFAGSYQLYGGLCNYLIHYRAYNLRYEFCLMSDLKDNPEQNAESGKFYMDSDGLYAVRHPQGYVQKGSLADEEIDLSNLDENLESPVLKRTILEITSKRGHTPNAFIDMQV